MRFVASSNDNELGAQHQQDTERSGLGPQQISVITAAVLQRVGDAMIASAREIVRSQERTSERAARNDNISLRNRSAASRKGRTWASWCRRIQAETGYNQRGAINALSDVIGLPATEIETFVKLHNRKREARITSMRHRAIIRYRTAGLSNKKIAERLNITPQHVGRIAKEIKIG